MLFENNYTVNECHSNDFNQALKLILLLLIKLKKNQKNCDRDNSVFRILLKSCIIRIIDEHHWIQIHVTNLYFHKIFIKNEIMYIKISESVL